MVDKMVTIGANLNPEGVDDELIERLKNQVEEGLGNLRLIKLMLDHPHISSEQLAEISNPVLVLAGSEDVIKESHTSLIYRSIRGSKLEITPDASLYVPFDQSKKLNQEIIDSLQNPRRSSSNIQKKIPQTAPRDFYGAPGMGDNYRVQVPNTPWQLKALA